MKKLLFLILILASCTSHKEDAELTKKMLLKTDQDFSMMSQEKGMKEAFLFYAADEVIKMREGAVPLFGIKELTKDMENLPDGMLKLQWVPIKSDVSGDLGYTFGKYEFRMVGKDTVEYGTYVTIWKKQENGTWKYVLDAGNSTPRL
jgi:ketosteroid isomerase-like protein